MGNLSKLAKQTGKNAVDKIKFNWWTYNRSMDLVNKKIGNAGTIGDRTFGKHVHEVKKRLRKGDAKGLKQYLSDN